MKRIAFITDIHLDEAYPINIGVDAKKNWQRILDDLHRRQIQEVIFGGDIGDPDVNQWFFETLKGFNFNAILGNHDSYGKATRYYHPKEAVQYDQLYYFKDEGSFRYIFLDTSNEELSQPQREALMLWLDTSLHILLFIHHPVLAVETPLDKLYPLRDRDEVNGLLQASGKKINLFCGHYHMYDEQVVGNIHQIVTPAASYQIIKEADTLVTDSAEFGYRILTITGDIIQTEYINLLA